jgi:TIR domain
MSDRRAIFISHASPEDNPFTLWLGAKLAALGYEVWADVLRLTGGEDWQRKLENTIRERACKVLLVANARSVQRQGVRNEIQIASEVARKIEDQEFIIPLKLSPFDAPFLIVQAQYIDFERGWAQGFLELLAALDERYSIPRLGMGNTDLWQAVQLIHGKQITSVPEKLVSNWLEVRRTPSLLYYYPAKRSDGNASGYPSATFSDGFFSCDRFRSTTFKKLRINRFLHSGWPALGLHKTDARNIFADLVNQGLGRVLRTKGLKSYQMSNRAICWWLGQGAPDGRIGFLWKESNGNRQLQGFSPKRGVHWHFGISASFRSVPSLHVRVKSRLIFTEDRTTPLTSAARMHRLRRSFAKGWRNARWRDMLLAFLYWLADGSTILDVPLGSSEDLVLTLPSLSFVSPVSISNLATTPEPDPDDPDEDFVGDEEVSDEA